AFDHAAAARVLLERVTAAPGGAEEMEDVDMRRFGEGIDHEPRARVRQRSVGVVPQPVRERRQDVDAQGADGFALGGPPLVIAIAVRQIQSVEEYAAESIGVPLEGV